MLKHIKSTESWDEKSLGAKGFTLVELLVVIVILGILAAVVVLAVSGITNRGQDSACATDARTLRTAAEAYITQVEPTVNADEGDLVTAGFLSEESDLHTMTITAGTPATVAVDPVVGEACD